MPSRKRLNLPSGERGSQSRARSSSGEYERFAGASVHEPHSAPAASTSGRRTGSASTTTSWPARTVAPMRETIGGVSPPPSQRENRKLDMGGGTSGVGVEGIDEGAHGVHGGVARHAHVATEELPGVDVEGGDVQRDRAVPRGV